MLERSNVVYVYDGTYYGLMCCVFESFYSHEIPCAIVADSAQQLSMLPPKFIETDTDKAHRVMRSIPNKISAKAEELVKLCFLSQLDDKELLILDFLKKGYKYGARVVYMLADDTVNKISKAVKNLTNEAHHFKGFVRFKVYDDMMFSQIEPKNYVLPLIKHHFCDRFPNESFVIYDKTHCQALVYKPYSSAIIQVDKVDLDEPDETEMKYQQLWRDYYNAIAIEQRYNPRCRMTHLPKRFWGDMTEFQSPSKLISKQKAES
ncbi:MAG: TIGR03915 family putative DNA repair protein [Clostridia bacterium]|nr:TIGR03915 family putative DNA repair protein [Clostridia bacterium]